MKSMAFANNAAVLAVALAVIGCASGPHECPPVGKTETPSWTRLARSRGLPLPAARPEQHDGGRIFPAHRHPARGTIICLHGISTHAAWFAPMAEVLNARGYRLICPNRPGSGQSPRVTEIADGNAEEWLAALASAFAEARKSGGPVFLLGTSWGAKLAVAVGDLHREEIDGLILLAPAFRAQAQTPGLSLRVLLGHWLAPDGTISSPEPKAYLRGSESGAPADAESARLLAAIRSDGLMLCRATYRLHWESRGLQKSGLAALRKKPLPTLAIFAMEDQIVDRRASEADAEKISAKIERLPGEGHGVQIESPRAIANVLVPWMEAVRGRAASVNLQSGASALNQSRKSNH